MTESDEVEEILYEAHYLGVKNKVIEKAKDWINRKKMPKGVAYRRALDRYKKEGKIAFENALKISPNDDSDRILLKQANELLANL